MIGKIEKVRRSDSGAGRGEGQKDQKDQKVRRRRWREGRVRRIGKIGKVRRSDSGGREEGRSIGAERSERSEGQTAAVGRGKGQKDRKDQNLHVHHSKLQ